MRLVVLYLIGVIFGLGISFGGMANPAKVVNFFDIAGTWDPSLALVMGGALVTTFVGYRVILRRPAPLWDGVFHLPTRRDIDLRLIGGSAVFGVGWGITGYCPGGVLPAVGTGKGSVLLFVAAMLGGIVLARLLMGAKLAHMPAKNA